MIKNSKRIRVAKNIVSYETKDGTKYQARKRYNNKLVNETFDTIEEAQQFLIDIEPTIKQPNFDYPLTFIEAIFNKDENVDIVYIENNFEENIKYLLETLSEREQLVLTKRMIEGFTLEATALQMGVSKERIRQIENKAIRRIRIPARIQYLTRGYEYIQMREDVAKLTTELELEKARLVYLLANPERIEITKEEIKNNITLETLDLSVRTYNCLRRAGIKTIGETIIKSVDELRRIRNMGGKSIRELKEKLHEFGFILKEE